MPDLRKRQVWNTAEWCLAQAYRVKTNATIVFPVKFQPRDDILMHFGTLYSEYRVLDTWRIKFHFRLVGGGHLDRKIYQVQKHQSKCATSSFCVKMRLLEIVEITFWEICIFFSTLLLLSRSFGCVICTCAPLKTFLFGHSLKSNSIPQPQKFDSSEIA